MRSALLGLLGLAVTAPSIVALAGQPLAALEAAPVDLELAPQPAPSVRTIAVLILSGEEAGVPLSEVYADARRAVETHTALRVAALDAIGLAEREAAIRECAGQGDCFARKVRAAATTQVDLLLTASIDRLDEGLLLGLRLVDIESGQQIGASGDEVPVGMSVLGAMERQLADVFPSDVWGQVADLRIETDPSNAEVSVAGRSCASPCELTRLFPGTYEVAAKKSGYLDWSGTVTLKAGGSGELVATLQEPERSLVSNPLFWAGVVAGAAAIGLTTFLILRPTDHLVNVCVAEEPGLCD